MPITVTLDTYETAALDVGENTRFARPFFIEGIDVSGVGGNKSEALWLAYEAVLTAITGNPLRTPERDFVSPRRFLLEPVSDDQARGRVIYENLVFGGGPISAYLVRDSGYMRTLETNQVPGSRDPIIVTFNGTTASAGSGGSVLKITDRVTFQIMAPMRTILVSGLRFGRPDEGFQEGVTYVNDALWPSAGAEPNLFPKPKGYWRLDKFETEQSVYGGYYTFAAQATTKVLEDWSEFGTLRNNQTGRFVPVSGAERVALLSPAYAYGITTGNGCVRVGFNPVLDFTSIFGW